MRCSRFRERMAHLDREDRLAGESGLAAHLKTCPACDAVWRSHLRLLKDLEGPWPSPEAGDLAPRVLARLESRDLRAVPIGRWAMAATLALAALALGYFFGTQSADFTAPEGGADSAYRDALAVLPPGSSDVAYLEPGGGVARVSEGRVP